MKTLGLPFKDSLLAVCFVSILVSPITPLSRADDPEHLPLERITVTRGIVCIAGEKIDFPDIAKFVEDKEALLIFIQTPERAGANRLRKSAEEAGLLGKQIFVSEEKGGRIQLADNIADAVLVTSNVTISEGEVLRTLRPRATGYLGEKALTKPVPSGYEDWSHPFHGPDNNPQSNDTYVQGKFRTQFIATPKFSPMPEQTVIGGGRLYKAMGHIAHKANQNKHLNTLLCVNAFNGTILWKRPLPKGFMIHRNTMIATEDGLYMGDYDSCKFFDGETGEIREEITIPQGIAEGPVWKWMGISDGVLYALAGSREVAVDTQTSDKRGMGHWPWGMWKGHDYADPNTAFGFGKTIVAFDLKTKKLLWSHREEDFIDARALVMKGDRIVGYAPEKFLLALDRGTGKPLWKNTGKDLLEAIGPNGKAQHYITGYATSCYMKCTSDYLFFAGPQRSQLVAASMKDGSLAWVYEETGNLQLVLREDAVYAAGPQRSEGGVKLDYQTGDVLATFPARRACTRATGCADSIFFRASGGTVRVETATNTAKHIAPMRPPCQDGVIVSNGHLYWGPWMCGCQLSLYGNIALAPQFLPGEAETPIEEKEAFAGAFIQSANEIAEVAGLGAQPGDWLRYCGNDARSYVTSVPIPVEARKPAWTVRAAAKGELPTAPVAAGGLVFSATRAGVISAFDAESGKSIWKNYTAGPVYYPPAISDDRLFAGSADGKVYAFEAKTGKLLWTFRAGPREKMIPVFGKLVSSWPVAGGVAVEKGTVYAASGITHYDGTYVVALDAKTGQLKSSNISSGTLSSIVDSGISLQGNVYISEGELRFLGGGVYETARYDLKTLACLNEPKVQTSSEFRTAFYPYYPEYNRYMSLQHARKDGNILNHDANYEGLYFTNLALQKPLSPGREAFYKDAAGEFIRRMNRQRPNHPGKPESIWEDKKDRRFNSFIVSGDRLLAAGHPDEKEDEAFLAVININDGTDMWVEKLPVPAVKGGTAIDSKGRIFVALENGELRRY